MQKPKRFPVVATQRGPILARFFEQRKRAHHIGANEFVRAVNGTIDMAFGGEMNDRARTMAFECVADQFAIENVALLEGIPRMTLERLEVLQIACVCQLVEIQN